MFRKYWELGFSVTPTLGKRAFLNEWSRWSNEKQPESLIDEYETKYSSSYYGIGIILGPASNLVALDCDSDSKDIKDLCPLSNVMKFGSKGFTSFFRPGDGITNCEAFRNNQDKNSPKEHEGVEILFTGRQTVIPPSFNPDANRPYKWLTPDALDSLVELPVLTPQMLVPVFNHIRGFETTNAVGRKMDHAPGRNNRLTIIACAMLCNEAFKQDDEIAAELVAIDAREHPSPLFCDPMESDFKKTGNSFKAALQFVKRHRKQLERKGLVSDTPIEIKTIDIADLVKPKDTMSKFPEADGLIYTIQKMVLSVSRSYQDELALGSSLAICSAMASNRFHIEGKPAITHQYIMNVARSGLGKGAGFYVANKLFGPNALEKYNLLGLRNYSSIAAFVQNLPAQRSRLDMIDEFGSVIEAFANGSQIAKELESLLAELYTDRGDYWRGHFTKTSGNVGGCFAPAVTVYANIQEEILVESAKKSMIASGLLGRFLFFSGDTSADFNESYNFNLDVTELARECERIFPFHSLEPMLPDGTLITDPGKIEPVREPLIIDASVKNYRRELDRLMYDKERELEGQDDSTGAIFISRFLQMAERIAIVNAVCNDRREILRSDYDYGMAVVKASSRRSSEYLRSIGATRNEKKVKWIVRTLRKHGFMSHSKLLKNSHLSSREFKDIIDTMIQSNQITEFKDASTSVRHYKTM